MGKEFYKLSFWEENKPFLAVNHIWLVIHVVFKLWLSYPMSKSGLSKNCPVVLWSSLQVVRLLSVCQGMAHHKTKQNKTYCNPLNPSVVRLNSLLAVAHVSSRVCWATGSTGSSAASHFFRSSLEEGRLSVSDWFWVGAGLDSAGAEGDSSTSSTGLWALRFWLSLRRICFFSLCYTEVIA